MFGLRLAVSDDREDATPLLVAAFTGRETAVELLLAAGADISMTNRRGATPVMAAAEAYDPAALKRLLAAGGDPNARDRQGLTPLMAAANSGRPELVRLLHPGAPIPQRARCPVPCSGSSTLAAVRSTAPLTSPGT